MLAISLLPILYSHLVLIAVVAQQSYPLGDFSTQCSDYYADNAGYACEPLTRQCETLAYFRAQAGGLSTLSSIAELLFNTTSAALANASSLSFSTSELVPGEGLYIPLRCICNGIFSSHNVSYRIMPGDTFVKIANFTYEGLTTCQAVQSANPNHSPFHLAAGKMFVFPLRCACPSPAQKRKGIKMLVTYPVGSFGETISSVLDMFAVKKHELLEANKLPNASVMLYAATTVLLPFRKKPTIPPNSSSTPTIPPNSSSMAGAQGSEIRVHVTAASVVPASIVIFILITIVAGWYAYQSHIRNIGQKHLIRSNMALPPSPPPLKKPPKHYAFTMDLSKCMSDLAIKRSLNKYAIAEMNEATQCFSPSLRIKGAAYRGMIQGRPVVVKSFAGRDVSQELRVLQTLHHSNIISLLGVCSASLEHTYLVYECVENGSLHHWLHAHARSSSCVLHWHQRLQIALDIALALEYIHEHTYPQFVHNNISSSHILLDSKLRAKLSNFSLSKPIAKVMDLRERQCVGVEGYKAPEIVMEGRVSLQTDVYAFGVVLLKMMSGEEATSMQGDGDEVNVLSEAIGPLLSGPDARDKLRAWMDHCLQDVVSLDSAYAFASIARSCVAIEPLDRPTARTVAFTLSKLL